MVWLCDLTCLNDVITCDMILWMFEDVWDWVGEGLKVM